MFGFLIASAAPPSFRLCVVFPMDRLQGRPRVREHSCEDCDAHPADEARNGSADAHLTEPQQILGALVFSELHAPERQDNSGRAAQRAPTRHSRSASAAQVEGGQTPEHRTDRDFSGARVCEQARRLATLAQAMRRRARRSEKISRSSARISDKRSCRGTSRMLQPVYSNRVLFPRWAQLCPIPAWACGDGCSRFQYTDHSQEP